MRLHAVPAALVACCLAGVYLEGGQAFVPASRPPCSTTGACISSSSPSSPCTISSSRSSAASLFGRGERSASIIPPLAMAPQSAQQKKGGGGGGGGGGKQQQKAQQQAQKQEAAAGAGAAAGVGAVGAAAGAAEGEEEAVGVAKALARPSESRAEELRRAKLQERSKSKKTGFINPIEIPIKAGRAARRALEKLGNVEEPAPKNPDDYRLYFDKKFMYAVPAPSEKTPTVLVVGATGETGRQVVKKLILKGYRVQVLVRNLYSTTLNLLGTGVSYVKGDLGDTASLRTACEGADKVVFVAQARDDSPADARAVEYQGLRNLAQAFQDTRVTESGKRVTTKRTLFKFRKPVDRDVWGVDPGQLPAGGAQGSWTVEDAKAGRPTFKGVLPATGAAAVTLESKKLTLNLAKFGGLLTLFKAEAADPATQFRFVIRTSLYAEQGVQYELPLPPVRGRFLAFRMNFKDFVPMKDGKPYAGLGLGALGLGGGAKVALDPSDVRQFAVLASRDTAGSGDGSFALTMEGVKVFRARAEPDLVVLSSSDITPQTALTSLTEMEAGQDPALAGLQEERVRGERRNYYRAQGELALKNSGLAYTIVRISGFTSSPTEGRPLSVSRAGNNMGLISRPDAAEVAINCLFNPNVCNTEIYASENPRYGDRDIQRLLNELVELPF